MSVALGINKRSYNFWPNNFNNTRDSLGAIYVSVAEFHRLRMYGAAYALYVVIRNASQPAMDPPLRSLMNSDFARAIVMFSPRPSLHATYWGALQIKSMRSLRFSAYSRRSGVSTERGGPYLETIRYAKDWCELTIFISNYDNSRIVIFGRAIRVTACRPRLI